MVASLRLAVGKSTSRSWQMQIFKVSGMSCGHCVRAIGEAIRALDAAAEVQVELASGEVRVASRLSQEQLLAAIREEGYEAQPA
uniref:Heavy metal transport/detoxification protein n=2 Tax=Ectopseudomonas TaxID=3236654 RepID=A4XQH5_ECTM1